jgi:glutamate formiminotransferase/glutamate formiminotransferase/formiminotetrahydrofolate cyclodeaminase
MHQAFQAVTTEAAKRGVEVAGSELIGLAPQAAFNQAAAASLQLDPFNPAQILETSIANAMSADQGPDPTLSDFLTAVAAAKPTPAGGSVAALVGSLAASLGVMGARLDSRTDEEQRLTQLQDRLHRLVQEDAEAYSKLVQAYKIPKHDPDRPQSITAALHQATEVPLTIAEMSCETGRLLLTLCKSAKPLVRSDLTVGIHIALAAATAGCHTAKVNIKHQSNQQFTESALRRITETERSLEELKALCYTPPSNL